MQIALNCTSATVPLTHIESIADVLLPQIKDVASVLYLLPTATARDHVKVLQAVFKLPVMQQLQPAAVLQLMQAEAAVNTEQGYAGWSRVLIMELLAQLPAASKLALGNVMPLLQAAIAACHNHAVKALCSLPATASVPVADVMKMLLAALDSGLDGVVAHLSSLPAASNMSPDDWTRIFTSAISSKADCDYAALCKLPAADLAAQEVVADLLRSAVHAQLYAAAVALLALPAADSIPQEHVFQCMQKLAAQAAAIRQGYGHLVRGPCREPSATAEDTLAALCKLEALQDVSRMQLLELLDCIVQHDNYEASYTLELLSQLPAARSIPADVMRQQMQEAVQQERSDLLSALCQCPSAANIDADTLLQCILQTDAAEWNTQRQLCKLAADQHLNSSQLKTIMLKFIDDSQCPWRFLDGKLAAAAQLTSEDVAELLSAAVKHNLIRSVEMLCKLKAARALSSSTIARLISGALDHPHAAGVVKALCSLPAAQDIPEDAAAELTHKAEQSGDRRNVTALLILRPRQSQRLRRQG